MNDDHIPLAGMTAPPYSQITQFYYQGSYYWIYGRLSLKFNDVISAKEANDSFLSIWEPKGEAN